MDHADIAALAKEIAPVVRAAIANATEPLLRRIEQLEAREIVHGKDGEKGDRGEPGESGAQGGCGPEGPKGPQGEKGESLTPEDIAPLIFSEVTRAVETAGEVFIAKAAERAAMLVPKPMDGRDGRDGLPGLAGMKGADGLNGKDGRDGLDGLGYDDLTEELDDGGRTVFRRYVCGERVKEFRHTTSTILDRGVFTSERSYAVGDAVSFGGSLWIAQRQTETSERPGETNDAWRLAVKRGRDGKDYRPELERKRTPVAVG